MAARQSHADVEYPSPTESMSMLLVAAALEGARHSQTSVTQHYGRRRGDTLHLLNDSLAGETICAWSSRHHHFTAKGLDSPMIAKRAAIEAYSQIISLIGDKDSATRRLLQDILNDVQERADGVSDGLDEGQKDRLAWD